MAMCDALGYPPLMSFTEFERQQALNRGGAARHMGVNEARVEKMLHAMLPMPPRAHAMARTPRTRWGGFEHDAPPEHTPRNPHRPLAGPLSPAAGPSTLRQVLGPPAEPPQWQAQVAAHCEQFKRQQLAQHRQREAHTYHAFWPPPPDFSHRQPANQQKHHQKLLTKHCRSPRVHDKHERDVRAEVRKRPQWTSKVRRRPTALAAAALAASQP
eukprot:4064537-Prymnesium_polylepis.2